MGWFQRRLPILLSFTIAVAGALVAASWRDALPRAFAQTRATETPPPINQPAADSNVVVSADLYRLKSVTDVQLSPDGTRVAYVVQHTDRPGRPYTQVWTADVASGRSARLGDQEGSNPRWAPDGSRIAYLGQNASGQSTLVVARHNGTDSSAIAPISGTNHPLPSMGERFSWSPDGKQIAFVSSTPGPEGDPDGDPIVITRYLYKPPSSHPVRWNDNRRLHLFITDVASKQVRQLTDGKYYEHSIGWSPKGDRLVFISNREEDSDRVFNYDLFTVEPATGTVRQLTQTKSAEYRPVWSPDGRSIAYQGTKRPLTSSETTMEDTHVWVMDADTLARREVGSAIDNRQGAPQWSQDGRSLYFTVQQRGSVALYRLPAEGGAPQAVLPADRESVTSWSVGKGDIVACALSRPSSPTELFVTSPPAAAKALTTLNAELTGRKEIGAVEAFTFKSFDGMEIEAFLTKPAGLNASAGTKHPLIVMIHGGPHGQQGPAFNHKAQVYAGRGWAALMVNYRGSTGYGQKFADAIFRDQNGAEGKDVLAGVDAALANFRWLDADRLGVEGGSYGGQLSNWLITQSTRFKAAIPAASISNLVSHNYMSYYHDYLPVEFGAYPHTDRQVMDLLWERSAVRYVDQVKTPTLFIHGDNDNNVNIAEAEQFFIALKDVGVETVMVRYPREGHGLRESRHIIDSIDRSIAWYEKHFGNARRSMR